MKRKSSWKWNLFISFDQLDYRFTKVGINCWSIHWTTTNKLSYLLVHTVVTSWPSHDFYNELKSLLDSISSLTFLWCIGNQREHKVQGLNMLEHKTRLVCAKGGLLSEKSGGFLLLPTLQKNIPFYYPKLLYPVRGIDNKPLERLEG